MFGPETENQEGAPAGENDSAVVVDLTEPLEKQEKPLTAVDAGDQGGKVDKTEGADDDKGRREERPADAGDDELDRAPKPWRKRLNREIRQKIEARGEAAAATVRADEAEQELARERARRIEPREETPDTTALDVKLDAAEAKLAKAIEDGESATVAKLNREIAELAGQKATKLAAPKRVERREEPAPRERQQPAPRQGTTATGRAFVEANDDWWTDPDQAPARSAVIALDQQLIKAGSDPNSEAHYQRIAKRAKDMGLKVKIRQPFDDEGGDDMGTEVDLNDEPQRRKREPPMGGNGNQRGRVNTEIRDARAGKIALSEKDKETMRTFKLDPMNPSHLRAFAKSRQERILQDAGQ